MKQKTKIFIIVGVGLVVAALLVYFLFFFGESKDVADADNSVGGKYTDDRFPLKRNSGGANVRALQTYLNPLLEPNGGKELVVDGKFGPKTEAACELIFGEKICTEANFNNIKALAASASK